MLFEFTTAGFGGQGILYLGDVLAEAALREGRNVAFLPTYGVAMRGGTANCVVTISDDEVGSPLLECPDGAVIMNQPSLLKFQSVMRPGGIVIANLSLIDAQLYNRSDVRIVWIPATEIARVKIGSERAANVIALGAFLKAEPIVKIETVEAVFRDAAGHKKLAAETNIAAFRAGLDYIPA
jgi:2-oxoglutarate ferredoxin oxidoreductase subunit gamma